jgi:hypothetical protein
LDVNEGGVFSEQIIESADGRDEAKINLQSRWCTWERFAANEVRQHGAGYKKSFL